ncbi:HCL425Cp [Eremothecium sinecaudum]|uniref:HCL425Cp n=1 Tax=Eremothecium sinecaudum TaxID=45286 RepID=A0A120K1V1_9SACH|nr:HCL425Cp [Eremothecium sinecaudum]AMD19726.1 HCL425Cp [Eremothecium sinecaudum]
MSDLEVPTSPLLKSPTKDLLKKNQQMKTSYQYSSDAINHDSSETAESSLLQDLDIILHKKLQLNSPFEKQGLPGSNGGGSNGPGVSYQLKEDSRQEEEEYEQLGGAGEDDDDEFTNVDEIDGPISPSPGCSGLSDLPNNTPSNNNMNSGSNKYKYSKGDHIQEAVDENLPVDEEYQKQLDQRAQEISSGLEFHTISKPKLEWSLKSFYSLPYEISEWFDLKDYAMLGKTKSAFDDRFDSVKFLEDTDYSAECINTLSNEISTLSLDYSALLSLCYISFGNYDRMDGPEEHITRLRKNCIMLTKKSLPVIIKVFKDNAECCRDKSTNLSQYNSLLFFSSTLLYFITCTCIQEASFEKETVDEAIHVIQDLEVIEFITTYIEHWRWHSRLCMRIRNMIMLLFKLLVLQFGDEEKFKTVENFINAFHGIETFENSPEKLTVSPLDYEAFRVDISSRYPISKSLESKIPKFFDNPNSLSQFLEIPRPKAQSSIKQALPEPQVHIATPAPSPPNSPVSSYTPKARKSFQTNISYPSLYPSDDEDNDDELEYRIGWKEKSDKNGSVPYNVQEAIKILSNNVEISLALKQLWHERKLFMIQERGWNDGTETKDDPYDYFLRKEDGPEIETMRRVENYYRKCLPSFNSLIYVLLQTIESNQNNHDYFLSELADDVSLDILGPQLEISRAKEILLRSSTAIIYTILKWFKLSHILKFEHFSSLLYDSKLTDVFIPLLSKFTYNYTDRIYNKMANSSHSFIKKCSEFNPLYKESYKSCDDNYKTPQNSDINLKMVSAEVYMLEILSEVVGKKTYRLKELPLTIGSLFNKLYQIFNVDIYHPILRLVKELTPFKNKRWKSEHIELISGVYLYEKLSLVDNWVTGKDVSSEMHDAYGHEIALRAMLQFYNFSHYKVPMEQCGYTEKQSKSFFSKESEILTSNY